MARSRKCTGRPYLRARSQVLAASDVCHLCGHPGANEVDHLIPRSAGGRVADPTNMAPVHGARSRCPVCKRCCNQVRGAGLRQVPRPAPTSRVW